MYLRCTPSQDRIPMVDLIITLMFAATVSGASQHIYGDGLAQVSHLIPYSFNQTNVLYDMGPKRSKGCSYSWVAKISKLVLLPYFSSPGRVVEKISKLVLCAKVRNTPRGKSK